MTVGVFAHPIPQVAHVLADAVVSYDDELSVDESTRVANLATARLAEIDGVVTLSEDGVLDVSGLQNGALVAIHYLVDIAASARGVSREEIVADLRRYVDQ